MKFFNLSEEFLGFASCKPLSKTRWLWSEGKPICSKKYEEICINILDWTIYSAWFLPKSNQWCLVTFCSICWLWNLDFCGAEGWGEKTLLWLEATLQSPFNINDIWLQWLHMIFNYLPYGFNIIQLVLWRYVWLGGSCHPKPANVFWWAGLPWSCQFNPLEYSLGVFDEDRSW